MKKFAKYLLLLCAMLSLQLLPSFAEGQPEPVTLYVGQQMELKPYLFSQDELKAGTATWKSYQSDIASVSSAGVVRALKPGEVLISATVNAGNSIKEVRVKLTVKTAVNGVSVSESNLRLTVGEEKSITAKVSPIEGLQAPYMDGVNWKSTNDRIVKVDASGKVTGVAVGKAQVYAQSKDGGKMAFCDVEIYNAVKEVGVAPKSAILKVGEGVQLNVSVLPFEAPVKKVTYKSNNVKVAEVTEAGYVKAVGPGEGLIFITSLDGGRAVAVSIKVESMVSAIQLDKTYLELDAVNNNYKLIATLIPKDPALPPIENSIGWRSANPGIATVDANGLVRAVKGGQTEIQAVSIDGGFIASCTVYSKVQGTVNSLGFSSLKIIEPPTKLYAGQTAKVAYLAYPENANNRKIAVSVSPSTGMTASIKDGLIQLSPSRNGLYRVKLYSDSASEEFSVEVTTSVNGITLEAPKLTRYGQGFICYLGQTFDVDALVSLGGVALSELDLAQLKWSYPEGTIKLEKAPNNPDRVSVTLLKPENTYLEVSFLDGTIKHRIVLTYEPMAEAMTMAEQADVKLNYQFVPVFDLKAKANLRYGYTDVLSKAYDLYVEEVYMDSQFIKDEIAFESTNILELKAFADKMGEGSQKNALLDEWSKHLLRKNQLEMILRQSGNEYQRIITPSVLTDRNLKKLVFFEIKDGGIRSEFAGKALIRVVSRDGNLSKRMWVTVKAQNEDLILLDANGNVVATSNDIAKMRLEEKEAEAKRQFLASQKAKFKATPENALPADAYLESTWSAIVLKLITEAQFKGKYQRPATQADLMALLVQAYALETKKTFKPVTDRYFSNVKDDAAERAYQLGFIPATANRKFNALDPVSTKMLKDIMPKWFRATKTDIKGNVSLENLIGNQSSYTVEELIQKLVLVMKSN